MLNNVLMYFDFKKYFLFYTLIKCFFFHRMVLPAQILLVLSLVFVLMDGQEKIAVKILMTVPVQLVSTELLVLIEWALSYANVRLERYNPLLFIFSFRQIYI